MRHLGFDVSFYKIPWLNWLGFEIQCLHSHTFHEGGLKIDRNYLHAFLNTL